MKAAVTIAIPAWKGTFLRQSIASALNQDYPDVQVLVVDDCSPHPIREIVDEFQSDRLRYVRNPQNLGGKDPAGNWNRCLELCDTPYFALLPDDDVYEPTFISSLVSLAEQHPECNVFRAAINSIDPEGEVIGSFPVPPLHENCEEYLTAVFTQGRRQTICEFMYRTEALKALGGYSRIPLAWGSDYSSLFRFSLDGGIYSAQEVLAHYRDSEINISVDTSDTDQKLIALIDYYAEVEEIVCSLTPKMGETWAENTRKNIANYRIRSIAAHLFEADWDCFVRCLRQRKQNGISTWEWFKVGIRRLLFR